MKQVVQNYKTGELGIDEVPSPTVKANGLLVKTAASAVSAGTEKSKVDLARKNLLGKAMARPDQVKKVLDTLRKEGLRNTYNKVRNKLDSLSPLGYSAAGHVVAVGEGVTGFKVGDAVACGGAGYANHAELIWAPSNLCALVPAGVSLEQASFTTIGAIALQGVRQAEVSLGETVAVIGLGLLGQLAVQLLRASGCRVIGIDVDAWKVDLAKQHDADLALCRDDDVVAKTMAFTNGRGADSIVITAAAPDNDPLVLAGDIARDRAHVVIVGAVPIEVPRSPYYEKELDVRLSRSYGPGRYDRAYEEKGLDYPVGYVRWTQNRNMQAFLETLGSKRVTLDKLVTHRIALDDATRAYDLISGDSKEPFLGIVLQYPDMPAKDTAVLAPPGPRQKGPFRVGFIGAGSFAGGTLIPELARAQSVSLAKVCTASGLTARDASLRYGFDEAVASPAEIIDDEMINAVFIASRHDSHATLAARALRAGKTVFVEKPLALTRGELHDVVDASKSNARLVVGFNRRFSPHTRVAREAMTGVGALVINMRINAGAIPRDHWIHDPDSGGGRILGEVCHFVDLTQALTGSLIRRVYAAALGMPDADSMLRDNVCITLELESGSVASIVYTSKGDTAVNKERIEIFGGGRVALIDDFTTTTITRNGEAERIKTKQDKGHREEVRRLVQVLQGAAAPVPIDELRNSALATIAAIESLESGAPVML